jgi:hypothetical protein
MIYTHFFLLTIAFRKCQTGPAPPVSLFKIIITDEAFHCQEKTKQMRGEPSRISIHSCRPLAFMVAKNTRDMESGRMKNGHIGRLRRDPEPGSSFF